MLHDRQLLGLQSDLYVTARAACSQFDHTSVTCTLVQSSKMSSRKPHAAYRGEALNNGEITPELDAHELIS